MKLEDSGIVLLVAAIQIGLAWSMRWFNIVYAPLPMFLAAVAGGLLIKGIPKRASVVGALAGLVGGTFSEIAYHLERMEHYLSWIQLTPVERLWLGIAEIILYASLQSFFMAFFSWSTHHYNNSSRARELSKTIFEEPGDHLALPLYNPQAEKKRPPLKSKSDSPKRQYSEKIKS